MTWLLLAPRFARSIIIQLILWRQHGAKNKLSSNVAKDNDETIWLRRHRGEHINGINQNNLAQRQPWLAYRVNVVALIVSVA